MSQSARGAAIKRRQDARAARAWRKSLQHCFAPRPRITDDGEPLHTCMKPSGHQNRGDRVCRCAHGHEWPSFNERSAPQARLPYKDDE